LRRERQEGVVEERLDGSLHIISNGAALKYKEITERPRKEVVHKTDLRVYNRPQKPSKDHPWKRRWKNQNAASQQGTSAY